MSPRGAGVAGSWREEEGALCTGVRHQAQALMLSIFSPPDFMACSILYSVCAPPARNQPPGQSGLEGISTKRPAAVPRPARRRRGASPRPSPAEAFRNTSSARLSKTLRDCRAARRRASSRPCPRPRSPPRRGGCPRPSSRQTRASWWSRPVSGRVDAAATASDSCGVRPSDCPRGGRGVAARPLRGRSARRPRRRREHSADGIVRAHTVRYPRDDHAYAGPGGHERAFGVAAVEDARALVLAVAVIGHAVVVPAATAFGRDGGAATSLRKGRRREARRAGPRTASRRSPPR